MVCPHRRTALPIDDATSPTVASRNELAQESSLPIIYEYGRDKSSSHNIPAQHLKARRHGPLGKEKARSAAKIRQDKSVCIMCHFRKVKVSLPLYDDILNPSLLREVRWWSAMSQLQDLHF